MSNWMGSAWALSAALGAIGMLGLIYKRSMLGVIVSIQLMFLGAAVLFVAACGREGMQTDGHAFAVLIVVGGLVQTAGAYALATRMFYLKSKTSFLELRNLKR